MKRRFLDEGEKRAFILAKCKPSPFLYRLISSNNVGSSREGICIPCVNWKRRVEIGGLKRTKQPFLQLDQLICYLMQPGIHVEPDQRCMVRLIAGARQPDNPYRCVFPVPVATILDAVKENTYHACVFAWWEYNGRTEFFSSGHEARRVRSVVKSLLDDGQEL